MPFNLNPFLLKPWFLHVCSISLLKTPWEKEKLLVTSNFSFSHCVFYHFRELTAIFIKTEIVICKLFWFGRLKFVVCERVKGYCCFRILQEYCCHCYKVNTAVYGILFCITLEIFLGCIPFYCFNSLPNDKM